MSGTLYLRPLAANLSRDIGYFGKMDPYFQFSIGKQKVTSEVSRSGGVNPTWEEETPLVVAITSEAKMIVELREKRVLLPDSTIGTCQVNLNEVRLKQRYLKWVPLHWHNHHAGKVLFEAVFEREAPREYFGNAVNQASHQANGLNSQNVLNGNNRPNGPSGPNGHNIHRKFPSKSEVIHHYHNVNNNNNEPNGFNPYAPGNQPYVDYQYKNPNNVQQPALHHSLSEGVAYCPSNSNGSNDQLINSLNANRSVDINFSQKYPVFEEPQYQNAYRPGVNQGVNNENVNYMDDAAMAAAASKGNQMKDSQVLRKSEDKFDPLKVLKNAFNKIA